jgi:diguanylate cyclase (GGDEF)-like protein
LRLSRKRYTKRILGLLAILAVVTIAIAFPALFIHDHMETLVIERLGIEARNVAISIVHLIEQDIGQYRRLTNSTGYGDPQFDEAYYLRTNALLREIKQEIDADFIYSEVVVSDTEIAYVLDAEDMDSEDFSPFGERERITDNELVVFTQGRALFTDVVDYPDWGMLITGFAPITDATDGTIVGLVGVDFALEKVDDILWKINIVIALSFVTLIILISLVMYFLILLRIESQKTDYLSGLHSKKFHEFRLNDAIDDALSTKRPLSLMMIDIDRFKAINDTYGHQVGDRALKSIADVLKLNTRVVDTCSRYGGDEFVVILPETNLKDAVVAGQRIVDKVQQISQDFDGLAAGELTVSIGIAQWSLNETPESLMEKADKALYQSKETGRNKLTVYREAKQPG